MQNRKYSTRDHMNGAAAAWDTNNELPPLARPPTPRGEWRQLIAHRRPPCTPTRGVPSGHLGGEGSGVRFSPIGFTRMDMEVASPWLCTCGAKRK